MSELSKPVLRVLEKCFAAEIQGLPAQFGRGPYHKINGIPVSGAVARASADGLIEQTDHKMSGWPPVVIRGFQLTHKGRIAYCAWASASEATAP